MTPPSNNTSPRQTVSSVIVSLLYVTPGDRLTKGRAKKSGIILLIAGTGRRGFDCVAGTGGKLAANAVAVETEKVTHAAIKNR